jgi:hypothetical protein
MNLKSKTKNGGERLNVRDFGGGRGKPQQGKNQRNGWIGYLKLNKLKIN